MSYYIGVVGGRDYSDYNKLKDVLDYRLDMISEKDCTIVSGGAKGADNLAEKYARENNIKLVIFKADWSLGLKAGPLRNKKIVEQSDEVIAFWDGKSKGTYSTIQIATNTKTPCTVFKY